MPKKMKEASPHDEVRLVTVMTREQRSDVKRFCDRVGLDMERVAAQWILDRLNAEQSKPAKDRR